MIIKKLKLKNIRSYKEFEIEFPLGSTLLSGDIGSGKTSILLALQFALFGLQPGQKGNSILRQGEDNAEVQLICEIDGEEIEIIRTIKKSKNGSVSQEDSRLKIGKESYELSTSEMKNKIISLLEYPREFAKKSDLLYKYTVYTPQEGMKEIIQERPETRLDILRHIFGIDRYKRIKENSQIFLQKIKEDVKVKESQIREINQLKEKLVKTNEERIRISKEVSELSLILGRINEDKKTISERVESLRRIVEEKNKVDMEKSKKEGEIQGNKSIRLRLEREISLAKVQIGEKIEFSQEELEKVNALLTKHKKSLEQFNEKLMQLNSKIYSLTAQKEASSKLKEKVIALENCPTCFQSVGSEHKDKISKKTQFDIDDIEREAEQKLIEREQLFREVEREKQFINGYENDRALLEKNKIMAEHRKMIEIKMKSDMMVLNRTMEEIKVTEEEISLLASQIEKYVDSKIMYETEKKKFDNMDFESRRTEINLAEKRKEFEMQRNRADELSEDIFARESIREQMSYLRGLQDWLEEKFLPLIAMTETNVMITLRRDFSKVFNEWFTMLVSDTLSARLDEDFTPIIINQDYELDYDFLSGGERTAVALAYRLALNQIINSMLSKLKTRDLLILDEPTDGFSEQQLNKMRDIFDQLESKQIILVSHEQKIEGFVDNIIKIRKEGTSKIETRTEMK